MMKIRIDLERIRKKSPLVHCITNYVTADRLADIILASGASPIMADNYLEIEEILSKADSLIVNIGTISEDRKRSILKALEIANRDHIPVVLDPVGVSSSRFRRDLVREILENYKLSVIRGNFGEINYLVNGDSYVGIDDIGCGKVRKLEDYVRIGRSLSQATGAVVLVSGQHEVVADPTRVAAIGHGNRLMNFVTGMGDMESALIGTFLAGPMSAFKAGVSAAYLMRFFGEKLGDIGSFPGDLIAKVFSCRWIDAHIELLEGTFNFEERQVYGLARPRDKKKILAALASGMGIFQIRDKKANVEDLSKEIQELRDEILRDFPGVDLIVNDNLDLACKFKLGLHLGQDDIPVNEARKSLGAKAIIGASAHNVSEAILAENQGASYLGVGAFFPSRTKEDTVETGIEDLKEIVDSVSIPVFVIGGIDLEKLEKFKGISIGGACLSSYIFNEEDLEKVGEKTRSILERLKKL